MHQEVYDILCAEIRPALGCTGPIGCCYCAAQAYDAIGGEITAIEAKIDWGMAAKIDDVAFPGSEMLGAEMAIALGAVCGDLAAGLELLHKVTPEGEAKARKVAELVTILPAWDRDYLGGPLEMVVHTDRGVGRAITQGRADGLIYKECNGEILYQAEPDATSVAGKSPLIGYKIKDFYDCAKRTPVERLSFLLDAARLNSALAENALRSKVGLGIGPALLAAPDQTDAVRAKAAAAAGCEARMCGVELPAMSCGNKGNVGIAASMPLVSLAGDWGCTEEMLQRALAMSYLTALAVIHRIGKVPSMCSCMVAASLGVAAGAVVLKGGSEAQAEAAIQNTIPNVFGCVCDGAKPGCALRLSSSTGIALECAQLALAGVELTANQGVLAETADRSLDMLGTMALEAMVDSDRELCRQIFSKRRIFPLESLSQRITSRNTL